MVKTRMSTKGRMVLPVELRSRDGIEPGDEFDVERVGPGQYVLRRRARRNEGPIDLLLSCPVKGWFAPLDRTETTDSLSPPVFD